MTLNLIDKLGDWNPQLLRELKGRLKFFHVAIALAVSALVQLVVFLYQLRDFPNNRYSLIEKYCNLSKIYSQRQEELYRQQGLLNQQLYNYQGVKPLDKATINNLNAQLSKVGTQLSNFQKELRTDFCPANEINWQSWWRDHWEYIFLSFCVIFIFTLLVAGTYLLINDLAKEERRGTLNFIRLSPQSEMSILTGKLLGVPSLIYLTILVAVPLHLWAGLSAKIAFSYILYYYAILAASCIFFYSAALLFGLVSRFLSGFQPWLGSGAVLFFLYTTLMMVSASSASFNNSIAWLRLFEPWDVTNYLFPKLFNFYNGSPIEKWQFFYLPFGKSVVSVVGFYLLNFGLCTYGILQALQRCFRNPEAAVLSKGQSYLLVAYSQLMIWGFTLQYVKNNHKTNAHFWPDICLITVYNIVLLFSLIAFLSPHRQDVQDWERYRYQGVNRGKKFWQNPLWQDLIWGEKSPAIVAIVINLAIATIPVVIWISFNATTGIIKVFLAVALFISLILIYATVAQLILLMKTSKRSFWAISTIGTVMFLPSIILQLLGISYWKYPIVWLFSTFPWPAIQYAQTITIFIALLAELSVLTLLNLQLIKQVKLAGESATKALLARR